MKRVSVGLAATGLSPAFGAEPLIAANQENLRFVFQGDSITDGNRGRNEDPNHILGHGYCFAVCSRIGADFPRRGFQFFNRGISGNTIADLEKRWQTDTLDLKPDVVSVLIGRNDVNAVVDGKSGAMKADDFEKIYRRILTACKQQNADALLVLGVPFFFCGRLAYRSV